ncbi:MAG: membrane protein insertion efficiency factor YidD [Clostridia bacterium]|nr:membrane protein insertion efficiency factor YidD [Clostridia bacterium]MBO4428924.1 membrane protein insertion efficiency factor YidD [Clostridia bacterium]
MKHVAIFFVNLYRKFISPLKPPCCRFTPTCSQYAIEAFREWGFICGLGLTIWRVLRCNPFCRGGYDPVPKRKRRGERRENLKGEKEDV